MDFYTGIGIGEIKMAAKKYALAVFVILLNLTAFQFVLSFIVTFLINSIPDAKGLFDQTTEKGYFFIMSYNAVLSYVIPLIAFGHIFRRELRYRPRPDEMIPKEDYKHVFGETFLLYLTGWAAASACSVITTIISSLLKSIFGIPAVKAAFSDMMPKNLFTYLIFIFFICIVAPVCEEILYRHLLLKPLRKYSDTAAVLVTAFIFALSHFNFDQFLYAFALGSFLAIIAVRANSVVPAVIVHVINNIIACTSNYAPETFGNETIDDVFAVIRDIAPVISVILLILSLAAVVVTLLLRLPKMKNNCNIPVKKQLGALFGSPLILVSILMCLGYTVLRLYI